MVDAETFVASSTVVHGCVLTVLSNVVVSFAVLRAGAVAEQLLVVKVVKEPGNAFPAMIALVFIVTSFVLTVTKKTGPSMRTSAVHTVKLGLLMKAQGSPIS